MQEKSELRRMRTVPSRSCPNTSAPESTMGLTASSMSSNVSARDLQTSRSMPSSPEIPGSDGMEANSGISCSLAKARFWKLSWMAKGTTCPSNLSLSSWRNSGFRSRSDSPRTGYFTKTHSGLSVAMSRMKSYEMYASGRPYASATGRRSSISSATVLLVLNGLKKIMWCNPGMDAPSDR